MEINHPPKKDMRGRLEKWRSETGRTPMKRFSYMHDYATPEGTVIRVHPVVHSPRLLQSLKRFDSIKKTTSAAPLSARKQTRPPSSQNKVKIGRDGGLYRENQENIQPSVKPASKAQLHSLSTTKPSRREQLEEWIANRGSAVKSGHMTVRTANTDVRRRQLPPPLERTMFSTREIKNPRRPAEDQALRSGTSKANHVAYLRELKEQFQRDIDDTVTQILSEGDYQICDPGPTVESMSGSSSDGGAAVQGIGDSLGLARQLDFDCESLPFGGDQQAEIDSSCLHGNGAEEIQILSMAAGSGSGGGDQGYSGGDEDESVASEDVSQVIGSSCPTPTTQHKLLRRRSHVHFDPSLMFKSTAIKYSMALSEPRRRRRHTYVAGTPDAKEVKHRLLHLTPVRRSTRRNRNGPGLAVDQSLCFDSPSQATTARGEEEAYEGVEVIPNKALGFGVVRSPNL